MLNAERKAVFPTSPESILALGLVLTVAHQILLLPCPWAGQKVEQGPKAGDARNNRRPSAPSFVEIRSIISDILPRDVDRQPGRAVTYGLRYTDLDRILLSVPTIKKALAVREIPKRIRHHGQIVEGRVVGITREFDDFHHLEISRGRFLTDLDEAKLRAHAVLGSEAAKVLFPSQDPVGQSIQIGSDSFTVVGVAGQFFGQNNRPQDRDKDIYIPLSTSKKRYGDWVVSSLQGQSQKRQLSRIIVQDRDDKSVEETARRIKSILRPFHHAGGIEVVVVHPEELPR